MAQAVTYNDVRSEVVSLLQASATAYATTPDGTNRQYASATEIDDAILYADAEICMAIINTLQHPFQTTFVNTTSTFGRVSPLPTRNGMILRVFGLNGTPQTVVSMDGSADTIEVTAHGLATGDLIQFITTSVVGGGLSINTDYYVIYVDANTFKVATSYLNAIQGTAINLSLIEPSGTSIIEYTEAMKARSADEVKEAVSYASDFGTFSTPWFFIEGDYIYLTCNTGKLTYTDYTKTSSPQAPEPYRNAIVAGAIARLLKDGSDEGQMQYFNSLYSQYLQSIGAGSKVLAEIAAYPGTGVGV